MTPDGWRSLIVKAVQDNGEQLDRLALLMSRNDRGLQILRDLGYGVTGMDILSIAEGMCGVEQVLAEGSTTPTHIGVSASPNTQHRRGNTSPPALHL